MMRRDREIQEGLYDPGKKNMTRKVRCSQCGQMYDPAPRNARVTPDEDVYAPHGQKQSIVSESQRAAMFAEMDRRKAKGRWRRLLKKNPITRRFDPAPKRKASAWLTFVKAHKDMRNAKGMLDLKGISKLWHKRK